MTKTSTHVFPDVQKIIGTQLKMKPERIEPQSDLRNELGADSLDALEIIMSVEEHFEIDVEESEARKMRTVQDIVNYISGKLNA